MLAPQQQQQQQQQQQGMVENNNSSSHNDGKGASSLLDAVSPPLPRGDGATASTSSISSHGSSANNNHCSSLTPPRPSLLTATAARPSHAQSCNTNTRLQQHANHHQHHQQHRHHRGAAQSTTATAASLAARRKNNIASNKNNHHQGPSFLDHERFSQIPRFDRQEVHTGRVVGRGGFGVVKDVTSIKLQTTSSSSSDNSALLNSIRSEATTATATSSRSATIATPPSVGAAMRSISGGSGQQQQQGGGGGVRRMFRQSSKESDDISDATTAPIANNNPTTTTREQLARRVWSHKKSKKLDGKYVMKEVECRGPEDEASAFLKGMMDLAHEARFLASLSHPYILELRGLAAIEPNEQHDQQQQQQQQQERIIQSGTLSPPGYFIILDKLQETLPKRLNMWMHRDRACKGITGALTMNGRNRRKELLLDRILVAHDICSAMCYLHGKNIIYRDLKPDNIGFDAEGVLKLFDFGLAKELQQPRDKTMSNYNCLYHMTGFTGAIRYMAPEVGLYQPYNLLADVYSWAMLFWYLLALQPPMGLYTPNMFLDRVFQRGHRPAMKESWPEEWTNLMRQCWDVNMAVRPTFQEIRSSLKKFIRDVDPEVASFMHDDASRDGTVMTTRSKRSERSNEVKF